MSNHPDHGDNLTVLRESLADARVALTHLDPPFNANAGCKVLCKAPDGQGSAARIEAFDATWHGNDSAGPAQADVLRSGKAAAAGMRRAMRGFPGQNDRMADLAMMAVRLIELHRVPKPTGSRYRHCDPTAGHHLKIRLEAVSGKKQDFNEVIWLRTNADDFKTRLWPDKFA
jgi:site-specific DNA-methyltransferase (adenine-specific)